MTILVNFYICLNSRKLYDELAKFKMNVTDLGNGKVLVYGNGLNANQIATIITTCDRYGRYSEVNIESEEEAR